MLLHMELYLVDFMLRGDELGRVYICMTAWKEVRTPKGVVAGGEGL